MTFPCYFQSKPSKHLLGLSCPRHHCTSHSVSQGLYFPQVGHRGLCSFLLWMASCLCGETLQDMWIVALKLATQATRSANPRAHSTFQGPHSSNRHRRGLSKQPKLLLAPGAGESDQPLISSAFIAQESMQRSEMTFGFLQRTADNLARLNDSLVSLLAQKNHLRQAGQGICLCWNDAARAPLCGSELLFSLTAFSIH